MEPRSPLPKRLWQGPLLTKMLEGHVTREELLRFAATCSHCVLLVRDSRDVAISALLYHVYNAPYMGDLSLREKFLALLEQKERTPQDVALIDILAFVGEQGSHHGWRRLPLKLANKAESLASELPDAFFKFR